VTRLLESRETRAIDALLARDTWAGACWRRLSLPVKWNGRWKSNTREHTVPDRQVNELSKAAALRVIRV
jgi:hypothetical protein